jgi:hypothetical protein
VVGALIKPEQIKAYMFGSQAVTDWKQGSPIVWRGEDERKTSADKGEIVHLKRGRIVRTVTS